MAWDIESSYAPKAQCRFLNFDFSFCLSLFYFLNYSKLVKENYNDAHGADKPHAEEEDGVERGAQRAVVGELVMNDLTRGEPSDKEAGEHGTNGHEHLTRHIVAPVEKRLASEREPVDSATRQRTKHANDGAHTRLYPRPTLACDVQLLIEQRGANLMHGDGRRERRQGQESIE